MTSPPFFPACTSAAMISRMKSRRGVSGAAAGAVLILDGKGEQCSAEWERGKSEVRRQKPEVRMTIKIRVGGAGEMGRLRVWLAGWWI